MVRFLQQHRVDIRWALAIFLIAALVRTAFIVWVDADPRQAKNDSWFYYHAASLMADGRGYIHPFRGTPTADHPPAYTALLAGAYKLPGSDIWAGQALNVVLGAAGCSLVFALARLFANRNVAVGAGGLLTFFPSHVFFTALPITEVTFATTATALMLLFAWGAKEAGRRGKAFALTIGLGVGLATMVRGEGLGLILVFVAVWWFATRSPKATARFGAVAFAGLAVVLGGWMVRNQLQLGAPIPISTGNSVVLSISHWEFATGTGHVLRSVYVSRYYEELPFPEREVKAYRKQTADALEYMVTHPRHELSLIPKRFYYTYKDDHTAVDWVGHARISIGPSTLDRLRLISDVYYFSALGLALPGTVLWIKRKPQLGLLLLGVALWITALLSIFYFGSPRYRFVLTPIFCVAAAPALVAAMDWVRAGGWKLLGRFPSARQVGAP